MDGKHGLLRDSVDRGDILQRDDGAARRVVGIFEADQPGRCQRGLAALYDGGLHIVRVKRAVIAFDRARDRRGKNGKPAALGIVDVGGRLDDHLAAVAPVRDDRRQVGHRPRRQEQRVILAGQLRDQAFELVDGRIIAAAGISQRSGGGRSHHACGRQRYRVASEVVDDHGSNASHCRHHSDISVELLCAVKPLRTALSPKRRTQSAGSSLTYSLRRSLSLKSRLRSRGSP